MAGQGGAAATGEQPKAIIQAGRDLLHHHGAHTGCGQFNRQRHAIELATNLGDGGSIGFGKGKGRVDCPSAIDKEANRFTLGQIRERQGGIEIGQLQGRHAQNALTHHPQGFPAGHQDLELWTGAQQRLHQLGACLNQMLAIVQDQQQLLCTQLGGQGPNERVIRLLAHAQ